MGLNVFMLFVGFALGSLVFSLFLRLGISTALVVFGTVGLIATLIAFPLFRSERLA